MTPDDDPFRAFHRARFGMTLRRTLSTVAVSAALAVGLTVWVGAAPPPAAPAAAIPLVESSPTPVAAAEPVTTPTTLPAPAAPAAPPEPQPALPATGTSTWSIAIDTTGYQAEIDQCLWVRMDLGASAPIVGAHNYCGGGVVLEMAIGDTVTLTGTGLDGTYTVAAERDARGGDNAAQATTGLGDVVLQTCYWEDDGSARLVGLVMNSG